MSPLTGRHAKPLRRRNGGGVRFPASAGEEAMNAVRKLLRNKKGATAIEYGLIAALIAVAAIAAMQGLGNQLKTTFENVSSNMKAS
jgi:pilus assembly protein Flp/PilA